MADSKVNKETYDLIKDLRKQIPEINQLQPKTREKIGTYLIRAEHNIIRSRTSPYPPPDELERYEKLAPGSAKQLFDQVQKQTEHRMLMENTVIQAQQSRSNLGQIFAFILSLIIFSGSVFLIYTGHDKAGSTICIATLIGLATLFLTGKAKNSKSLEKKS